MQSRGLTNPSVQDLMSKYRVNLPGQVEAVWQPLYDYQASVTAATVSQLFFQVPLGQAGKTLADTNMNLAGSLPAGQMFAITGIQVEFYPTLPIYDPSALAGIAAINNYANDVLAFYRGGNIVLTIGSKPYLVQGNLMKFPPRNRLGVSAAAATTAAATTMNTQYAVATGPEFQTRDMVLESSQNFSVDIQNRAAVSAVGRIGVTLNGWLFRNAQ